MNEDSMLNILFWYIKSHLKLLVMYLSFSLIYVLVFILYSIELEAIVYAFLLTTFIGFFILIVDFIKFYRKHENLTLIKKHFSLMELPNCNSLIEKDYHSILNGLNDKINILTQEYDLKQTEMIDYYTLWVHQIKSPIAALRLLIQSEEGELNSELLVQLSKIEQYVEMVLGYLRIENASSDLNFKKYKLSDIVKQGVRKCANIFIKKNIKLVFEENDCIVVTDEKWLLFVLEQILNNALKYTNEGVIKISIDKENSILIIEDTGIGISEEDLPRIFEKGFTGYNGRIDKKATGIGLYLCKKVLNKLSHKILITSKLGIGTVVKIDLSLDELHIK